ncbi:MAG: hypothetical protein DCC71_18950 [Proteobacteria bacterium]|nr:MAG: hypothetical protein DCC71_18950 [Pseudomonadota bacterium]
MRTRRSLWRLAIAALAAALLSGCFVFDEMDKAKAIDMGAAIGNKPPSKDGARPAAEKKTASAAQAANAKPGAPSAKSWWETARTLTSEESSADIVGCRLSRGVEFMEKDDCLARGGSPE